MSELPAKREGDGKLLPDSPACPFCDLAETELVSPFGGQLSVATYWCRRCRTGFDYMKGQSAAGN